MDSVQPYRAQPRPGLVAEGIVIKGDVLADEDLIIAGQLDGNINIPDHALTIAPEGKVSGQLFAKIITVAGHVSGGVTASDSIEVLEGAFVDGDLTAPKVGIELGAWFQGKIEMKRAEAAVRVARYRLEHRGEPAPEA
jgi:cytoskeletal protein CcmA (bactofilin family)